MDDMPPAGDGAADARQPPPVQTEVIEEAIAATAACERVTAAHAAEAHGDEQAILGLVQDTADISRALVAVLSRWTPGGGRHVDLLVEACATACASCADAVADRHAEVAEACRSCRAALLVLVAAAHAQEP